MILIISHTQVERSTELVMDWLDSFTEKYMRFNGAELLSSSSSWSIELNDQLVSLNGLPKPEEVQVIWYRRWHQSGVIDYDFESLPYSVGDKINSHLMREYGKLSKFILGLYPNAYWLTEFSDVDVNKLEVLNAAKKNSFKIPPTIITNSKKDLTKFFKNHDRIIAKPIGDVQIISLKDKQVSLVMYTEEISSDLISSLPEYFFPSLFQKRLNKIKEFRVFYLDGDIFPMAIYSQSSQSTETDFRKYDKIKPNRRTPWSFKKEFNQKIINFMNALGLKTGSLDFVQTPNGELIFLEVNPVGQFSALSEYCNYNLEKKIAEHLIKKLNERKNRVFTQKISQTSANNIL